MGLAGRLIRRSPAVLAAPHRDLHAFRHNDGIVDQHPHGDDQSAQRNPLHLDGKDRHEEQRTNHGQKQRHADNNRSAPPHEERKNNDDDGHRHGKIDQEGVGRLFHHHVLLVDRLQLHPHRDLWRKLCQLGVGPFAHIDDVF